MKWVRYRVGETAARVGVLDNRGVHDAQAAYERYEKAGGIPIDGLAQALAGGWLAQAIRLMHESAFLNWIAEEGAGENTAAQGATLCAPLTDGQKFIGIGLNYRDHAREVGQPHPPSPPLFAKWTNSISGPRDPIVRPHGCANLDYEGELGVVIGRTVRDVDPDEAARAVFGYTVINDVSARDWQFRTGQWLAGKIGDGFAPMGPAVVGREEIADAQDLRIRTWVNDELRQDGHTSEMIFGVAALVSILSKIATLEAGDIIATGTPSGVGMSRKPPGYLRPGDRVRIEISDIGAIENDVVAPPEKVHSTLGNKGDYVEMK